MKHELFKLRNIIEAFRKVLCEGVSTLFAFWFCLSLPLTLLHSIQTAITKIA